MRLNKTCHQEISVIDIIRVVNKEGMYVTNPRRTVESITFTAYNFPSLMFRYKTFLRNKEQAKRNQPAIQGSWLIAQLSSLTTLP
jgi:hypothetical protein